MSLCNGSRDESGVVDHEAAGRDATELLRAGELRVGTDESTFNMVFCQRNYSQIKLVSITKRIGFDIRSPWGKKLLTVFFATFSDLRKVSANDRPRTGTRHSE